MQIISHRRNTIADLSDTKSSFGVEIDIRSFAGNLILNHDPFVNACLFSDWLPYYNHELLVLNIKEEGLEDSILSLLQKFSISDYFFLDQSMPYLIKTVTSGNKNTALRYSEYESIESLFLLRNLVSWVWIDYFTHFPINPDSYRRIHNLGFKTCLVSPELQGHNLSVMYSLISTIKKHNYSFNAVCTKYPDIWSLDFP